MDITSYILGKKAGGGGSPASLQNKSVTVTTNGTQDITADTGYDGLKKVALTTNVEPDLQTKNVTITENGTRTVINDIGYDGLEEVNITTNVTPNTQTKSITITENTTTTITPDTGYDGLSSVEVTTNVSGGGDVSEYFNDRSSGADENSNVLRDLIKKIPPFTITNPSKNYLFQNLVELEEVDLINLSSNTISTQGMFRNCLKLTTIKNIQNLNTSNVSNMSSMFRGCYLLDNPDLSNFNTINVTNMIQMFYGFGHTKNSNNENKTLNLSSFDMQKVTAVGNMFNDCQYLENLTFGINLGKGYTQQTANYNAYKLDLSSATSLTHDSLMSVINNLYDLNLTYNVAGGGTLYTQSLVLGTTNLAKLTAEEIAIAQNKGWSVQ